MAQWVKNLHAMQETWVQSLGQEDPLEKGMATHSSILAWRISEQRNLAGYHPKNRKESDMTKQLHTSEGCGRTPRVPRPWPCLPAHLYPSHSCGGSSSIGCSMGCPPPPTTRPAGQTQIHRRPLHETSALSKHTFFPHTADRPKRPGGMCEVLQIHHNLSA